jgi:hypothetical protein
MIAMPPVKQRNKNWTIPLSQRNPKKTLNSEKKPKKTPVPSKIRNYDNPDKNQSINTNRDVSRFIEFEETLFEDFDSIDFVGQEDSDHEECKLGEVREGKG